jgi:altronate hydrolase
MAQEAYGDRVDGIHCFVHPYGCSQLGDDMRNTQRLLASMVRHPNAGGVLVLSLGCENNNLGVFKDFLGEYDPERVKFLITQDVEDEIEVGMQLLDELTAYAAKTKRTKISADRLIVGLKCGGSDGLSGITANPLLGSFSDLLTRHGGTTLLTEVPEMFGAETILMNRCKDEATFNKTVDLINNFKEYFIRHGQEVYENPSPGNKAGGITTLEDKSLGCTQKGGAGEVQDVLSYCDPVKERGLNLVQGPGNDLCAITALMASGAQLVLFTTGRGTPVGAPIPTVKVATNTTLATRKHDWIDFNAGVLVQGAGMQETTEEFFKLILDIASGKQTQSEIHDYREIAIFKDGVTL